MIEILSTASNKWNEYLSYFDSSNRDIYFTEEYHKIHEANGDGIAQCFVYKDDKKIAIYPYMINEIKGYKLDSKYFDIESVYGYSGPLINTNDKVFINNFENEFLKYCLENNIVAEFIRFHPLIGNADIFSKNIQILHNRNTVYLDLSNGVDYIWNNCISSKNRNMIRKAEKNGLNIEINHDYTAFRDIYKLTMDKVSADDYYYFKEEYFSNIREMHNFILLNVKKEDMTIAAAIFLKYGEYFHYHLAGSLKQYLSLAPNNLLLWEAIKLACNEQTRLMHFGGGLSNDQNDNLFKFKSSFSKQQADYNIGKRIHNKKIYYFLIDQWEQQNNTKAKILLQYRIKK